MSDLTAASWFAHCIVADDVHGWDPLPLEVRDAVAAEMVRDQDRLGWPDLETALAMLDEWTWA